MAVVDPVLVDGGNAAGDKQIQELLLAVGKAGMLRERGQQVFFKEPQKFPLERNGRLAEFYQGDVGGALRICSVNILESCTRFFGDAIWVRTCA